MELIRELIRFYDDLVAVRDDADASKAFVNETIEYLEKLHYTLKTRRNFEPVYRPYLDHHFSYVEYLDIDKDYCFMYGYDYTFYIKGEPSTYESKNPEACLNIYRDIHGGTNEEIAEAVDGKLFVSIRMIRVWADDSHREPTLIHRPLNILYFGDKYLCSVMKMLIAEDILKECNVDIFDIVPKIEYIKDDD